ncbi:hypothetical protein [Erysipelothrix larvae]|nr:hypothetical protein [Erysipelothrix larvae]
MKDMIEKMGMSMDIPCYKNEGYDSYVFRVIYSALGQWCLTIAASKINEMDGVTKHHISIALNELIAKYIDLFPVLENILYSESSVKLSLHIQTVYLETGYLTLTNANLLQVSNFGDGLIFDNDFAIMLGLPNIRYEISGLGVLTTPKSIVLPVETKDFLIRDTLSPQEYCLCNFDSSDFSLKEIDINELEFFNPLSKKSPSSSWEKSPNTEFTIARRIKTRTYYRVINRNNDFYFAEMIEDERNGSLTAYEYRRDYFALKSLYDNPLRARVRRLDNNYSILSFEGHLPNREYYLLLLLAWPASNAFDKSSFIIINKALPFVGSVLNDIGIVIYEGEI